MGAWWMHSYYHRVECARAVWAPHHTEVLCHSPMVNYIVRVNHILFYLVCSLTVGSVTNDLLSSHIALRAILVFHYANCELWCYECGGPAVVALGSHQP